MRKGKFNINRDFGIEIEYLRPSNVSNEIIANAIQSTGIDCRVESYNHITRNNWKIVSDSSVYNTLPNMAGHNEIVSPRLKGYDGLLELSKVLKVLNDKGCKVNYNCGIHIHHDVTEKMVSNKKEANQFLFNLIKWTAKFEHHIYKLVSPSRLDRRRYSIPVRECFYGFRNNSNAKVVTNRISELLKRDVDNKYRNNNCEINSNQTYPQIQGNRSCGLNLRNVWTRGSVEFRYHNGSLNYDKIVSWLMVTQSIVNVVESKKYVILKYVENNAKGFNKFLTALGFNKPNADTVIKSAKKYSRARYKTLSSMEANYRGHRSYAYVADGIANN